MNFNNNNRREKSTNTISLKYKFYIWLKKNIYPRGGPTPPTAPPTPAL